MPPAADADPDPSGPRRHSPGRPGSPAPGTAGPDADDPLSPAARSAAPPNPTPAAAPPGGPPVTLILDAPDTDPPAQGWLDVMLGRALALLDAASTPATPNTTAPTPDHDPAPPNLTIVLADDAQMADLHQRYTGVAGTTDVLTFDHRDPTAADEEPAGPLHADLVLGRDVAVREAQTRGHDARTELLLYAVHGVLHLLGEDDHDPDAYRQMHQREDELLTALGVGPVFQSGIANRKSEITPPQEALP